MFQMALAFLLFAIGPLASAEPLSLGDVKAKNGVQLSAEELKQLMPGAKVVNLTAAGSTRRWQNDVDGTLVASSDNKGNTSSSGRSRPSSGNGTWRIGEKGTYCADIQWNVQHEDWCRYIFKVGDRYYGFAKLEDSAQGSEFEISK